MIVVPKKPPELLKMLAFLNTHAGVVPTTDTHVIGWEEGNDLLIVVGFNAWLGSTCMMHVAMAPDFHFTPRQMLQRCFWHAFVICQRKLVIGIVNSLNEKAMKYDEHLGFRELYRIPKMHDGGGDIVVFGMMKEECRYLLDPHTDQMVGHA